MTVSKYVLVVLSGACAVAGCLFPSLSDLSGGDGAVLPEASAAGDAGPTTFCSNVDATFCEDFDEPDGGYLARWYSIDLGAGNTLALESDASTSAPNALVAEIPAGASGGASMTKLLPDTATFYDLSFSIRLEPYDAGTGNVLINQIEVDGVDAGSAYTEYRFAQLPGATHFQTHVYYPDGGNVVSDLPMSVSFVPGQWHHVEEQLRVDPPPAKVTVFIDGTPALSTTIIEATDGAGTSELLAGLYHTNGPTGTWRVEIDDIVMRVK